MDLNEYIGLPWLWRGRDRSGVDCWGLCALIFRERLGIELPSFRDDYQTEADADALAGLIDGNKGPWRELLPCEERSGDALLMSIGGRPHHIGVISVPGLVLHIERGTGSLIENYHSLRLRRRVLGFYRHESLE